LAAECTQPLGETAYECKLTITDLKSDPVAPGKSIPDSIDFHVENAADPAGGWTGGLVVSNPGFPSSCVQALEWGNQSSGVTINFTVSPKTEDDANCGLITAEHPSVSAADFAKGLTATFNATWMATKETVKTTMTLTP
jgi:hypothetical protein